MHQLYHIKSRQVFLRGVNPDSDVKSTAASDLFYAIQHLTSHPLLPNSTLVESQLLPLKHIPIHTSTLPRPRRNNSIQPSRFKLPLQRSLNLSPRSHPSSLLLLHTLTLLRLLSISLFLGLRLTPPA